MTRSSHGLASQGRRAPPDPGADGATPRGARRRVLRTIAAFEAVKGALAIAAGLGLLSLLHRDLHRLAASLIGHIGLDPGTRYPVMILADIDALLSADLRPLLLAVAGYALVRFAEAYGLWRERAWGEWLGALSGALYLPFELRHFVHGPAVATAVVIAVNLAVVGFLGAQLWHRRRARPG